MNIGQIAKGLAAFAKNNSTVILTAGAVVGTVSTAFFAAKGAVEAKAHLDSFPEDLNTGPVGNKEVLKEVWPYFVPTALSVGLTVGCIIGAHQISTRKNAMIVSAYQLSQKALTEYKNEASKLLGDRKTAELEGNLAQNKVNENPAPSVVVMGSGSVLCMEGFTRRYFMSDMETIRRAENDLNKRMLGGTEYSTSMNELYQRIGLQLSDMGDDFGWNADVPINLSFSSVLTPEGKPCLVMEYKMPPFPHFFSNERSRWGRP